MLLPRPEAVQGAARRFHAPRYGAVFARERQGGRWYARAPHACWATRSSAMRDDHRHQLPHLVSRSLVALRRRGQLQNGDADFRRCSPWVRRSVDR